MRSLSAAQDTHGNAGTSGNNEVRDSSRTPRFGSASSSVRRRPAFGNSGCQSRMPRTWPQRWSTLKQVAKPGCAMCDNGCSFISGPACVKRKLCRISRRLRMPYEQFAHCWPCKTHTAISAAGLLDLLNAVAGNRQGLLSCSAVCCALYAMPRSKRRWVETHPTLIRRARGRRATGSRRAYGNVAW